MNVPIVHFTIIRVKFFFLIILLNIHKDSLHIIIICNTISELLLLYFNLNIDILLNIIYYFYFGLQNVNLNYFNNYLPIYYQ